MTATMDAASTTGTSHSAVDAFDIEAVCKADLASSPVVDIAGKYEIEFDTEISLCGRTMDVKVLFPSNDGGLDIFRLNADADPVQPQISACLAYTDYDKLLEVAQEALDEKEDGDAAIARSAYEDMKCHEHLEARAFGLH